MTNAKYHFSKQSPIFFNASRVAIHKPSDSICEKTFWSWSLPRVHCVCNSINDIKSSYIQDYVLWPQHIITQGSYVQIVNVWEKIKISAADCFNSNFCQMGTHITVMAKNTLYSKRTMQCSPYCTNILLQFFGVPMPSDHKTWSQFIVLQWCYFKSGATIFKEDL